MRLDEMADFVCRKVGQTDDASVLDCKEFLRAWYEMVWDSALWKNSQALATASSDVTDFSLVWVPLPIERVLNVQISSDNTVLDQIGIGTVFPFDPSLLTATGTAVRYIHLRPLVNAAKRTTGLSPTIFIDGSYDEDLNSTIFIRGYNSDHVPPQEVEETITITSANIGSATAVQIYTEVYAVTKPKTRGTLNFLFGAIYTIDPNLTEAQTYARIQILPAQNASSTFLIHGKLRCPKLLADGDAPQIEGLTNALLSLGQADMLQRQRQYGKAQVLQKEGAAMVAELLDAEKNQTAYEARIIPADIHGNPSYDDTFGSQGKGFW